MILLQKLCMNLGRFGVNNVTVMYKCYRPSISFARNRTGPEREVFWPHHLAHEWQALIKQRLEKIRLLSY
ncbi:hypothetical protein L484_025265 [Morus notabilis]|uniref:Uncharacterized protein n=1 Tax=Morus notabilis TaxID=981085 RepID=W9SIS6_9ROSA|nr:hypothetical protein L484_025265 [Morus notabilis]